MDKEWGIFKQLYDKNLIYRGLKVVPFSVGCGCSLSQFEANLNYKMVDDIALNSFEKRMKTTIMSEQFLDKLMKRMRLKYKGDK